MYVPAAFRVADDAAATLIGDIAAGHLVTAGPELFATFLPFVLDAGEPLLRGHLAAANPHADMLLSGPHQCLVLFTGVHGYVSPSWYPSKVEHGRVVPTWNYEAVEVRGTVTATRDPGWLRRLVGDLTDRHERTRPEPWSIDDAPPDFVEHQLGAIVGVDVVIERITAKAKLSQNRPEPDRVGVCDALAAGDTQQRGLAGAMERRRPRTTG